MTDEPEPRWHVRIPAPEVVFGNERRAYCTKPTEIEAQRECDRLNFNGVGSLAPPESCDHEWATSLAPGDVRCIKCHQPPVLEDGPKL